MLFTAEWSTTPLGFACLFGSAELVQLLLEHGGAGEGRRDEGKGGQERILVPDGVRYMD